MAPPSAQQEKQAQQKRDREIVGGVLATLAAAGATRASLEPVAAGLAADTAAARAGAKLSARAVGELTEHLVLAMLRFQRARLPRAVESTRATLMRGYPERAPGVLDDLAAEEARRERVFQRKVADRLRRDLPDALRTEDREERRAAVEKILERERRFAAQREDAMHDRATARAEMLAVKEASPLGAYWQLSPFVRNHTPDCVALAGQFWPWSVIEAVGPPPRHHGCQCSLYTLGEAVERDLMDRSQAGVDERDALDRARRALKDAELLEAALTKEEWLSWVDELCEAAANGGAMIALRPHPDAARRLAVDGGEPADQLHVTLKFLGDDHEALGEPLKERLKTALASFASDEEPLHGVTAGPGYFPPNPKHKADETPIFARVDVPGLEEFRERLVKALPAGLLEDSFPDYKPHMTVQYVKATDKPDLPEVPRTPLDFRHVELVLGGKRHRFELGSGTRVEEALPPRRYAKGFEHGGEFMPKVGGNPGRRALSGMKRALAQRLAPELPPSGRERMSRHRDVQIAGRGVRVPEGRAFDRTIDGRRYTSPPFSTSLYRDGKAWEPPARQARAGALELPAGPEPETVQATRRRETGAAHAKVLNALAARQTKVAPVEKGDHHATAAEALNAHGFLEVEHRGTYGGSEARYVGPDAASKLTVHVAHGGKVERVEWDPRDPEPPARVASSPPRTHDEFKADTQAFARDLARRNGRRGAHVGAVIFGTKATKFSDHAGEHRWNGDIVLGEDAGSSILEAAATRARGAQLTAGQRRSLWKTYQVAAHESLHAAAPISKADARDALANAWNEALVEELSHVEAARWLRRTGQADALQWRADNPLDPGALGGYTHYRVWLGGALDRAGVAPEDREDAIRSLLFDVRPLDRTRTLARMAAEAHGTKERDEVAALEKRKPAAQLEPEHLHALGFSDATFAPILTPDVAPTVGAAEPFTLGAATVRMGDSVSYSKRTLARGATEFETHARTGRVLRLREGHRGWTMDVARDGGGVDYAVLPGQVSRLDPDAAGERPSRPFGAAADHARVNGSDVRAGSKVSYPDGKGGESHAVVSRVLRDRNPHAPDSPGWLLEAVAANNRRVLLTPGNTRGELRASGVEDERGVGTPQGGLRPAGLMLTVEDRARLGRHFRLPAGAVAVPLSRLVPVGEPSPDELRRARERLMDPSGREKLPPLVVHPGSDGRFVVTGGIASLAAARSRGLDRVPAVVGPVAEVDRRLARARGAAAEGLRRAREILVRGGDAAGIARDAVGRPDAGAGFQAGMRQGFHAADERRGVASPLFGWDPLAKFHHGKDEPAEPWLEKQAETWAGRPAAAAKEPKKPVQDDAGVVTITKPAGGSNGARFAVDAEGRRWIVKDYRGDRDRVATELLANALYRELGIRVPEAGTLSFGGKPALAYPLVEGAPGGGKLRVGVQNRDLARGFMADAWLANWDVVGLEHDNLLWPEGTERVEADTPATRLDQGGSLQFRAMGGSKPFGPVPTEVWTMAGPRGQAFGTMALTPEVKRAGAARIAKLSDGRIEELAGGAGFASGRMRDEVVGALKARRDWMASYASGEVHEPRPAEGSTAREALAEGQAKLSLFPEQAAALEAFGSGWGEQANAHLRSGAPKEAASREVRMVVSELDSLMRHARTKREVAVHASLPARLMPDDGWESLSGKALREPGFLGAATDQARADREGAATLRLVLPEGSHAVYVPGVPDLASESVPAQPEVLVARGARMLVSHVEKVGKRTVIHATLAER